MPVKTMSKKVRSDEASLVKVLMTLAHTIAKEGFPQEPFIVQSDPSDETCFFICLWRNTGDRQVTSVEVAKNG